MACQYFCFRQYDYYCTNMEDYVDADTYYRYCRNYNYDDCPIYRAEDNGGCYITSACVGVLGCADDGEELMLLRNFRDTYMCGRCELHSEIQEYYEIAPQIVKKINAQRNFYEIYKRIYDKMLAPCIKEIRNSMPDEAYRIYKREYLKLKEQFYE